MNHVQTSLARAPYNIDDFGAYQAAALSVRDNMIVSYDLLGCLKIKARIPPLLVYTIIGVYYSVHILSPFFGIPVVPATTLFSPDYRSVHYMRMRRVEN